MSKEYDVLIIGTGIAGLSAAVTLLEAGHKVAIITREFDPNITNTFYAQGGIIFPEKNDDTFVGDVFTASSLSSSKKVAEMILEKSGDILQDILIDKAQTPFEKDENGKLKYTKEAAHSIDRILYQGDFTGRSIQVYLLNYIKDKKRFPNVDILVGHTAIDLITSPHHGVMISQRYEEDKVLGAYVLDQKQNQVWKIMSKFTILATGGIGALYLHHSNSEGARGDGHAMAKRAGAVLTDMEFIQFHPTTLFDSSGHRRFLISEAVRGEGGKLVNSEGERFMKKYHKDEELAPRDVVARAIVNELIETVHECVYLDISHEDAEWIKNRFPTIYANCLEAGIDITKNPIPVVPSAHYTCGGVKTNLKAESTLSNLYAVGEVACTGLHGANRLASTSLLEGLSFGHLGAKDILLKIENETLYPAHMIKDWVNGNEEVESALLAQDWTTVKQTMWNYAGLVRSKNRLARGQAMFRELSDEIQRFYKHANLDDSLIGLRNAVEVASLVISASKRNNESVGCFYRLN